MKLFLLAGICFEMLRSIHPNENKIDNNSSKPLSPGVMSCRDSNSLINRKWDMQKIRFLQDNQPYYYHRGNDKDNTIDFNDDHIVFQYDGTGIYHQSDGAEFNINWRLVPGPKQAIDYTIEDFRNNKDLEVHWEEVEVSENTLRYAEYYTHNNGVYSLGRATRTCKSSEFYVVNNCLVKGSSSH